MNTPTLHGARDQAVAPLFQPIRIGELTVHNRVVMAPMTRGFSPGGVPGADVAAYYARRATHGVGLVITEGTVVGDTPNVVPDGIPFFHGPGLAGWGRVADAVHEHGGLIFPQLWHLGAYDGSDAPPRSGIPAVGPSGIGLHGAPSGEAMTQAQIASAIDSFARAAADARRLGFDGVELHGGHGFLIDQFLWSATNRRTDRYRSRSRFATEVIAACRRAVGPHFPISLRISQWKMENYTARIANDPEQLEQMLAPLVDAGVDVFHCSMRRFWLPEFDGSDLSFAGWTKKVTGKPVIAVGSIGLADSVFQSAFEGKGAEVAAIDQVVAALVRGDFDLIALGRALVSEPEWVTKIRDGRRDELLAFSPADLTVLK